MDEDTEFPLPDDDDQPMAPDDMDDLVGGEAQNLDLSVSRDGGASTQGVSIGGLDISNDTGGGKEATSPPTGRNKRRSATKPRVRRKKRRKVVVDNDETELTNEHIKNMLADTTDIVRDIVHPATWVPGQQDQSLPQDRNKERLFQHLSYEQLFTRPSLGDDGRLAPELLDLWKLNTAPIQGKPFSFPWACNNLVEEDQGEEVEPGEVELARQQQDRESIDGVAADDEQLGIAKTGEDDDDVPPPFDDDIPPPEEDFDDQPPLGLEEDEENLPIQTPDDKRESRAMTRANKNTHKAALHFLERILVTHLISCFAVLFLSQQVGIPPCRRTIL